MIIISWNIRGLNSRIKKSTLRKLLSSHEPHFVFIQETKMDAFNPRLNKFLWKVGDLELLISPSMGNSGILLSLWRSSYFTGESHRVEKNWIAISGQIPSLNFKGCVINVYNPCDREERAQVWNSVSEYCLNIQCPCLMIGDFNEVLDPLERDSNQVSQLGVMEFQHFVSKVQLTEIPAKNGWFTGFSGQAKSKLDRLLVNPDWIAKISCPSTLTPKAKRIRPLPFLSFLIRHQLASEVIQVSKLLAQPSRVYADYQRSME